MPEPVNSPKLELALPDTFSHPSPIRQTQMGILFRDLDGFLYVLRFFGEETSLSSPTARIVSAALMCIHQISTVLSKRSDQCSEQPRARIPPNEHSSFLDVQSTQGTMILCLIPDIQTIPNERDIRIRLLGCLAEREHALDYQTGAAREEAPVLSDLLEVANGRWSAHALELRIKAQTPGGRTSLPGDPR
jgi:hypothetical protein